MTWAMEKKSSSMMSPCISETSVEVILKQTQMFSAKSPFFLYVLAMVLAQLDVIACDSAVDCH